MDIHFHVSGNMTIHVLPSEKIDKILELVINNNQKLNQIIMTNEELLASLTAANDKVDKISTEIVALQALVTSTPSVPQNIVDAVASLTAKLQAADDLNADAPVA